MIGPPGSPAMVAPFVFSFRFFFFLLSKVGSGLKRSTEHYTRYSLTPRKPIASSIHSVGFPSKSLISTLGGAMPLKRVSSRPHERTSPRSRQVTYPPINEGSSFVAFCTDVADAYVGRKWGGEKGHALSIDVYHCSMYYPIHS